jgi:hypothetical protein
MFIDSCPGLGFCLHMMRRDPRRTSFAAIEAVSIGPVVPG